MVPILFPLNTERWSLDVYGGRLVLMYPLKANSKNPRGISTEQHQCEWKEN